jgi:hypothetical protein
VKFAEIIRSSEAVRQTFDCLPTHRWWWRTILALHGKPCRDDLTDDQRTAILSKGFRFYAALYSFLAFLLASLAVMLFFIPLTKGVYWPAMALFAAFYLGASSVLAFKGARLYTHNATTASALLVVFFMAVIGFLMLFAGAVSLVINRQLPQYGLITSAFLILFVLFGIGSYLLEVLYLFYSSAGRAAAPPRQHGDSGRGAARR